MKKFFMWCIPLFTAIIIASITLIVIVSNNKNNTIYATEFSYKHENVLNLRLNDEVIFNKTEFNIAPSNCTERIFLTTNDSNIIQINNLTNKITAKKLGNCTLLANIKSGATQTLSTIIEIKVTNKIDDSDKPIETYNYTFNMENNFATIEFVAGATKDENEIEIKSGKENLKITIREQHSITIEFISKGFAEIEITCNTKKLIFNIEIV